MWTWPLNSAIGVTTAHKASERVANGTCFQVWAWMTNKCRTKMTQKKDITQEIFHKERGGQPTRRRRPRKRKEAIGTREELGILVLRRGVPSPLDIGPPDSVCFSPPKQAIASSEPNFWTHSLQIHCNGIAEPRSRPSLGPVRKTRPYNWHRLWERLLVRWWV